MSTRKLSLALILFVSLSGSLGCDDSTPAIDAAAGDASVTDARAGDIAATDQTIADTRPARDGGADAKAKDSATADQKPADQSLADQKTAGDAAMSFPAVLDGVWLVGWSGGANHFSWVRFTVPKPSNGTATIADGKALFGNVPFWNCSGATTWDLASKPNTFQLHFPFSTCVSGGFRSTSYTFSNLKVPTASWYPKGALLVADVSASPAAAGPFKAYKFPPSQCDAQMKCTDPLK